MKKMKKSIIMVFALVVMLLSAFSLNKGDAQAAGNYSIRINKATNVVTVYSNGKPDRAFVCSTGNATPIGTFRTSQKLRWHVLDGPSYGQYCTRIHGSVLFHSVWYYANGDYASQSYVQYNKLGTTASHGCVRLTVADSKWIYENCPLGTSVTVFWGSSNDDPLGKPEAIKIPARFGSRGWDPTDPLAGNPYSGYRPSVNVSGAQTTIEYGSSFQPFAGISANDSLGNDISGRLTYSGKVRTKKLGRYNITYSVTDALGRSASSVVTYQVVDSKKAIIKGVKKTQKKEYNSTFRPKSKITAYTVDKKKLTNKIKVKVIYPGSKKERLYKKSTIKLKKLGTYKFNYYVTNPNNKKVTKVTGKVVVRDTKKPKLTGVPTKRTLEYNTVRNLRNGIKSKLLSGKNMVSKVVVKVRVPGSGKYVKLSSNTSKSYRFNRLGTYYVQYSVANPYNKKAVTTKTSTFVIRDTKAPNLLGVVAAKTLECNDFLDLKAGVTAKLVSGIDVSSGIVIKVKVPETQEFVTLTAEQYRKYYFEKPGIYTIEYSVVNPGNVKAVTKKIMTVTVSAGQISPDDAAKVTPDEWK